MRPKRDGKLRILVLGAGQMGGRVAEDLVDSTHVQSIVFADRDPLAALALKNRLSHTSVRVSHVTLDAEAFDSLVDVMRGCDVVASAIGPFFRYEHRLVRAAITAGVDYVSICDEWDVVERILDEFHGLARDAGCVIIPGLGASPGISNVLAMALSAELDTVESVAIHILLPAEIGGGQAALRHGLYIMDGDCGIWRDGRRVTIPACSETVVCQFPKVGRQRLWNMGHSEPVTLPLALQDVRDVDFYMGFGVFTRVMALLGRLGVYRRQALADQLASLLNRLLPTHEKRSPEAYFRVDVRGRSNGRATHKMGCGCATMRDATGLALSVGALMVGRGELLVSEPGVYPPELCIDPTSFIDALSQRGICGYRDLEMTNPLIVS